jgi:hypothetical protein
LRGLGLLISAITLAGLYFRFRVLANILAERTTDVVALLERSVIISANETLVRSGVDQFTFVLSFLLWHCAPPLKVNESAMTMPVKCVCEYDGAVIDFFERGFGGSGGLKRIRKI